MLQAQNYQFEITFLQLFTGSIIRVVRDEGDEVVEVEVVDDEVVEVDVVDDEVEVVDDEVGNILLKFYKQKMKKI